MMHLMALLLPQVPAEPIGARVVRFYPNEPVTRKSKRKAQAQHYARNRERIRASVRARYWAKKA
jgi:hypothetical protein